MKQKQQAAPEYTTDADGQELAYIALANTDRRATLYAEDFQRLRDAGWSPHWSLTNTGGRFAYVLAHARNTMNRPRSITLARLVAQAAKGQRITYADGDRTNLRRDNLLIVKGGGSSKTHTSALSPSKNAALRLIPTVTSETPQTPQTPAAARSRPVRPTESRAPSEPTATYTPRVVDRAALSAGVREKLVIGLAGAVSTGAGPASDAYSAAKKKYYIPKIPDAGQHATPKVTW